MKHPIFPVYFLREQNHIAIVQRRLCQTPHFLKMEHISRYGERRITDILPQTLRSIRIMFRRFHLIIIILPILTSKIRAKSICYEKLTPHFHDARILVWTSIKRIFTRWKNRLFRNTLKMDTVRTFCLAYIYKMFYIISGRPIKHVKNAIIIYYPRITHN